MRMVLLLAVACAGCASTREQVASLTGGGIETAISAEKKTATESGVIGWDWATGIPAGATNGTVISPRLPSPAVALLAPEFSQPEIQLTSAAEESGTVTIASVNGIEVRNYTRLSALLENLARGGEPARVRLDDGREADIEPGHLLRLLHGTAPESEQIRVTEDGNPWVIVRDNGVRCKMFPRVERFRGLMQLVVTLQVLWGEERVLPGNIRVTCDGEPLEILTAAQTLSVLYDDSVSEKRSDGEARRIDYRDVAGLESYVIPTNYKRLAAKYEEETRLVFHPPQPALVSVPGLSYPGPAILGDARALGAYLLTPELYVPNAPPRTGWIMFQSDRLKSGGHIRIEIDLDDNGSSVCEFDIPPSE